MQTTDHGIKEMKTKRVTLEYSSTDLEIGQMKDYKLWSSFTRDEGGKTGRLVVGYVPPPHATTTLHTFNYKVATREDLEEIKDMLDHILEDWSTDNADGK